MFKQCMYRSWDRMSGWNEHLLICHLIMLISNYLLYGWNALALRDSFLFSRTFIWDRLSPTRSTSYHVRFIYAVLHGWQPSYRLYKLKPFVSKLFLFSSTKTSHPALNKIRFTVVLCCLISSYIIQQSLLNTIAFFTLIMRGTEIIANRSCLLVLRSQFSNFIISFCLQIFGLKFENRSSVALK